MRRMLLLATGLAVGCDLPTMPSDDSDTGGSACPQPGWVVPSASSLYVSSFVVDGIALFAGFDPYASYDTGPSSCVDPEGGGATWMIAVDDAPFAQVKLQADETGDQGLNTGNLVIDVLGADPPVTFSAGDFVLGSWDQGSLTPTFQATLTNVQGQKGGRFVTVAFVGEATP